MNDRARRATDRPWRPYIIAVLLLMLAALIAGRVTAPRFTVRAAEAVPSPSALPPGVATFHDTEQDVTCWIAQGVGMSCLPDQWLASARLEDAAP